MFRQFVFAISNLLKIKTIANAELVYLMSNNPIIFISYYRQDSLYTNLFREQYSEVTVEVVYTLKRVKKYALDSARLRRKDG